MLYLMSPRLVCFQNQTWEFTVHQILLLLYLEWDNWHFAVSETSKRHLMVPSCLNPNHQPLLQMGCWITWLSLLYMKMRFMNCKLHLLKFYFRLSNWLTRDHSNNWSHTSAIPCWTRIYPIITRSKKKTSTGPRLQRSELECELESGILMNIVQLLCSLVGLWNSIK